MDLGLQKQNNEVNILYKLFSTCHGVYKVNNELLGDELDKAMFEFSQFSIENSQDPGIKFITRSDQDKNLYMETYNTFEFESDLQRMSCISYDKQAN